MTCDHVIIIDEGKSKATGSPSELVQDMRAAGKIILEIQADAETASGALSRLENVKKVIHEDSSDDWTQFSLLVDSGTDTRERIANLANQYGWPIRTLHRHQATLEDVFVELTRKD